MNNQKIFIHDNELPLTDSNDIFKKYVQSNPNLDPQYIQIHCGKYNQETRIWIESLWEKYFPYAEPRFLERIRSSAKGDGFHTFSWQMYLACVFLDKEYELEKNSGTGPDISILINNRRYWIEAVITTPGNDKQTAGMPQGGDIYQSLDPRVARISNALTAKFNTYKDKYLNKYCQLNEPFIVAINGTNTKTMSGSRAIEAVVFARGNDVLKQTSTGSLEGGFYELRESVKIQKVDKKVELPTKYFCDDTYKEISGVIYCEMHIINANNFVPIPKTNPMPPTNSAIIIKESHNIAGL